jgi:monofunctional biosynthetic peptidoglycan transglycosylase
LALRRLPLPAFASFTLPRAVKRLLAGLGALIVLPYLLTVIYLVVNPPVTTLMLWRAVQGYGIDQRWVALEDISPHLVQTVVTSEDAPFCTHYGIDLDVLGELAGQAAEEGGRTVRGGSTITMQTAKNLFLWPSRSYVRKTLELPLALWIDLVWPKRRIIEVYLNIVEWGPGIYGAEAAARRHFGKSAAALSRREAALLAAALPNPLARSAGKPSRLHQRMAAALRLRVPGTLPYLHCLPRTRGG